jgi:hypothetical protein
MRGAALLVMFVDHFRSNALSAWSPGKFGYSDMASIFVFVSGCAGGVVFRGILRDRGFLACCGKAFVRILQLSVAIVTTVFVTNCMATRLELSLLDPGFGVELPACAIQIIGILSLYCLLVAMLPLMVWLNERHWLWLLLPSLLVYLAALLLEPGRESPSVLFRITGFQPLSWQLLFVTGILVYPLLQFRERERSSRRGLLIIASIVMLDVSCLDALCFGKTHGIWTDKSYLGPLVYLHGVSVVFLLMTFLPDPENRLWNMWFTRRIVACGQSSLLVFCAGTVVQVLVEQLVFPQRTSLCVPILHVGLLWGSCFSFAGKRSEEGAPQGVAEKCASPLAPRRSKWNGHPPREGGRGPVVR